MTGAEIGDYVSIGGRVGRINDFRPNGRGGHEAYVEGDGGLSFADWYDVANLEEADAPADHYDSVEAITVDGYTGKLGRNCYIEIHGQVGSGDPQMISSRAELDAFIARLRSAGDEAWPVAEASND